MASGRTERKRREALATWRLATSDESVYVRPSPHALVDAANENPEDLECSRDVDADARVYKPMRNPLLTML
jgi:hypothetical protein